MKQILHQLGMSYKEFSEHYEIPYNTVRQWAQGIRQPPKYVLKLLNEKIEKESKGYQIPIEKNYYMLGVEWKHGYSEYNCNSIEERENLKKTILSEDKKAIFTTKNFIEII